MLRTAATFAVPAWRGAGYGQRVTCGVGRRPALPSIALRSLSLSGRSVRLATQPTSTDKPDVPEVLPRSLTESAPADTDEVEEFPPPRPSPSGPRHLSIAMAKRILAPHLAPLAEQSSWQAAREELLESERAAASTHEEARAGSDANTAAGTSDPVVPASSSSPVARVRAPVPLRRPYAFLRQLSHKWLHRLVSMLQYGLSSENNFVRVYFDGDEAFTAMFDAISQARERVCLETFMWKPDRIGLRMIQLLEEAAARGCQVLVLYDAAGSFSLRSSHLAKLAAMPTAHVVAYNPLVGLLLRSTGKDFSHRTHRKILVCDSTVAFAGGMNTSEQYAGPRLGIHEFRDTHARIRGPAVDHLADVFFQSLQEAHAHDRATWTTLLSNLRTKTTHRITESSMFTRTLLWLKAQSRTPSAQKAGRYFEGTRDRQKERMRKLQQDEVALVEAGLRRERAAEAIRLARARQGGTEAGSTDGELVHTPEDASTAIAPRATAAGRMPTARASLKRMRRFVSQRLRLLAQFSSSREQFEQIDALVSSASRQWEEAWRRVKLVTNKAKQVKRDYLDDEEEGQPTTTTISNNTNGADTELPPSPLHPALPSTALSSLTASFTASPLPPPKHSHTHASSDSAAPSSPPSSASSSPSPTIRVSPEFSNVFLQILPSNTLRGQFAIHHSLMDVLDAAQDYVLITNPFLIPPRGIERAILNAGARGVTVRMIVGGRSDTPYMRWSSTHIYHRFLVHPSIHLYEYEPRILHAKTLTADGLISVVGSFNLDFLSSHKLLEVCMCMVSAPLARHMELQSDEDVKHCRKITKESLGQRNIAEKMLHWFAFHVTRTVYSFMK